MNESKEATAVRRLGPAPANDAGSPVRRALPDCHWEGVETLRYKDEGDAPYRDVTRQVLFQLPELHCEWRYFEVAPGGHSTLECHQHAHAVMILRGRGRCLVGNTVHEVAERDLVTVPPDTWHQFRAGDDAPLGFLCLVNRDRDRPRLPQADDIEWLKRDPRDRRLHQDRFVSARFDEVPAEPLAPHDGAPLLQRAGGFVKLTLNRPAEHNRLDPADVDAMSALFADLAADPAMRALVITGAGDKTFSSGYTLQALVDELDARFERMLDALEALPFVTIAMLNGSVYGGATDMALCCDLRLGTPGLKMFMPAAKIGLHYYPGGLRRYVSRLGLPAASKLMLTAATIESDEMLRIGFMTEMHERGALAARVDVLLEQIGRNEPRVVAKMKRHMHDLAHAGIPPGLLERIEADYRASVESAELRGRLDAMLAGKKAGKG